MDVKTAFLYGLNDQLIYIKILKGTETKANKNIVCRLLKALYSLKQFPWLWCKKLSRFLLKKLGLACIHTDHNIFIIKAGLNSLIVSTFIDDIKVMTWKGSGIIYYVKAKLIVVFLIVDMGPISFYLKLKIESDRENRTIKLLQLVCINKIFSKFYFDKANMVNTSIKKTILFQTKVKGEGEATAVEKQRYQVMNGSIMFSMVETRSNISFVTSVVSWFAKNPCHQYTKVVKTIFWYLKSSKEQRITYDG